MRPERSPTPAGTHTLCLAHSHAHSHTPSPLPRPTHPLRPTGEKRGAFLALDQLRCPSRKPSPTPHTPNTPLAPQHCPAPPPTSPLRQKKEPAFPGHPRCGQNTGCSLRVSTHRHQNDLRPLPGSQDFTAQTASSPGLPTLELPSLLCSQSSNLQAQALIFQHFQGLTTPHPTHPAHPVL